MLLLDYNHIIDSFNYLKSLLGIETHDCNDIQLEDIA